jgi:hypothetical protein
VEREIFVERFHAAAAAALSFARQYVLENLSDKLVFRVRLNQSHDSNLRPDQKVYPGDSTPQRAYELHRCHAEEVVEALWRDGTVPEWVDIAVIGQTASETVMELLCCGRYTANESRLYHQQAGIAPFSVHGPTLPPGYKAGDLFSIWHRLAVWGLDEIELAMPHICKVWSLTAFGSQFDDSILASLPIFQNVEIIELKESPINGEGLRSLSQHPKLRVLRIDLARHELFNLKDPVVFPTIEVLDIQHLPPRPCGLEEWLERLPALKSLTLGSEGSISFSGSISGSLDFLIIAADNVLGAARLPGNVGHLALHLSKATPSDLSRLLNGVRKVAALSLTRTAVDDVLAKELVCRLNPEYVNLVHTKVSSDCLRHLRQMHPDIRIHPSPAVAK